MVTVNIGNWEDNRQCKNLTPKQADALLFPGIDGKRGSRGSPSKTRALCKGCPVKSLCLRQAIENGLEGNWAATTKKERDEMAPIFGLMVHSIHEVMPEEPKQEDSSGKRIAKYLHVKPTTSYYEWMDNATPSDEEILAAV
jgi:hypothetical protein